MAIHNIVNTTHITAMNVDAFNLAAVAQGDIDNGLFVVLDTFGLADGNAVYGGYEYEVELASADSTEVYVVDTPEVGYDIEMQMYNDPRHFYNVAGKPMSIKLLNPKADCIEEPATAFASGTLPTTAGQYVPLAANGKLGTPTANAPQSGCYFRIEGFHYIGIGAEKVPTVILRCMAN